jgi:hypothetical protein
MKRILTPLLSALAFNASATTLDFSYNLPTVRENGTAIAAGDLTKCVIYNLSTSPATALVEVPATRNTHSLPLMPYPGTTTTVTMSMRYGLQCVDKYGLTSAMSNEVLVSTKLQSGRNMMVTTKVVSAGPY